MGRLVNIIFLPSLFISVCTPAIELTIYNWPNYLAPQIKELFTKETGHTLKELYYDSDDARNQLLLSEHAPAIDVTILDNRTSRDFSKVLTQQPDYPYSNKKYIAKQFANICGADSIPYFWGTLGISYRTSKTNRPIKHWMDILSPAPELSGHVVMINDAVDMVSIALKAQGDTINSQDKGELKQAFELLKKQRPHVLSYEYSLDAVADNGKPDDVYAVVTYSGDFYALREKSSAQDWTYVVPIEGTALWVDCLSISKNSRNPKEAAEFINFLIRPDIARLNGELLGFTPAMNDKDLSEKIKNDDIAYPSSDILRRSETLELPRSGNHIRNAIYFSVLK